MTTRRKKYTLAALVLASEKLARIQKYLHNNRLQLAYYYNSNLGWSDPDKEKSYEAYHAAHLDVINRIGLVQGDLDSFRSNWLVSK